MKSLFFALLPSFAGKGWSAILLFGSMPWFAANMGHEAFGLLGILTTLQFLLSFADLGLSPSITREISLAQERGQVDLQADLLTTLGRILTIIAVTACAPVILFASPLASFWLRPESLSMEVVSSSLRWMAIASISQLLMSFYSAALAGIGRQGVLNALSAGFATIRTFGGVLVVLFDLPIDRFFVWFGSIGVAGWIVFHFVATKLVARGAKGKWRPELLLEQRRFIGWTTVVLVSGGAIGQLDRLAVSHFRPLQEFGAYNLVLSLLAIPMTVLGALLPVITPLLVAAWASGDPTRIRLVFWRATTYATLIILPVPLLLFALPNVALLAWSGDPNLANQSITLAARLLAIGTIFQCSLHVPWSIQIAMSDTRRNGLFNLIALPMLAALAIPASLKLGMPGAAAIPLLYSVGMHVFVLPKTLAAFGQPRYSYTVLCCLLPLLFSPLATWVVDGFVSPHVHSRVGFIIYGASLSLLISMPFAILIFRNRNSRDYTLD